MEIITADAARTLGLKRYFTGAPCRKGHLAERLVCNNDCVDCVAERYAKSASVNRHKWNAARRAKYASDPAYRARVRSLCNENRARHRDAASQRRRERYANDPEYRARILAAAEAKRNRPDHKAKLRQYALKRNYGISRAEYDAMFERQRGLCAICGQSSDKTLHVDHCHASGKVRKLLCNHCNRGLGCFRDSPELLLRATDYLRRFDCP